MPSERYYIDHALNAGDLVAVKDHEMQHLVKVMRTQIGEEVELVNGRGVLAHAMLESISKSEAKLSVQSRTDSKEDIPLIMAQALPRINRLDNLLEKCTELGATEFWLFPGERSERKELTDHQLERLQAVCIAAMKQCGRLFLPKIVMKEKLSQWEKTPYPLLFGDVSENASVLSGQFKKGVIFATGPESGFTEHEMDQLQRLGGQGVKLNKHILRTDTAAIAACAFISWLTLKGSAKA
jgi:16S rRNA (uracil1498-N3)-methyltransferase